MGDKGKPVGIITERDILKRVVSESRDSESSKTSEIMSKPLIVGGPYMYVEDAAKLMFKKNIKKLPIMDKGDLVGIITMSDIAKVAGLEPQIVGAVDELKKDGWLPSRKIERVIDFYLT